MAPETGARRQIWSGPHSPTKELAERFNLRHQTVKDAIHDLKAWNGLAPDDNIRVFTDGDVEDRQGRYLGNIFDEAGVDR